MDFERKNTESSFESIEDEAESLQERGNELEQRETRLSEALAQLEKDAAVTKSLEANERELESQREGLESKRTSALEALASRQEALESLEAVNEQSNAELEALRELGEDVGEADSVIEDRRRWLQESYTRVQHLYELLGESYEKIGDFSPSGEKGLREVGENKVEGNDAPPLLKALGLDRFRDEATSQQNDADPKTALANYMAEHNWSDKDYPTYSKTLEWRRLVHAAYPNYKRPPLDRQTARNLLIEYMYSNNYSKYDYPTYSTDPEWQYLTLTAFPETMDIVDKWARSINPNYENMSLLSLSRCI